MDGSAKILRPVARRVSGMPTSDGAGREAHARDRHAGAATISIRS